jgi:hypothetical protein
MFIDILKLKKVSYSFMLTMSWYLSFSCFPSLGIFKFRLIWNNNFVIKMNYVSLAVFLGVHVFRTFCFVVLFVLLFFHHTIYWYILIVGYIHQMVLSFFGADLSTCKIVMLELSLFEFFLSKSVTSTCIVVLLFNYILKMTLL